MELKTSPRMKTRSIGETQNKDLNKRLEEGVISAWSNSLASSTNYFSRKKKYRLGNSHAINRECHIAHLVTEPTFLKYIFLAAK